MYTHADHQPEPTGKAVANTISSGRAIKTMPAARNPVPSSISAGHTPVIQQSPVIQLLKIEQEERLRPLIKEIENFQELLSNLSDPLDFGMGKLGLESNYISKALSLPDQLEAIKPAITAVKALKTEISTDADIPISEDHILAFASHTMADALRPLLARAEALIKQLNSKEAVNQKEAYLQLKGLTKEASKVLTTEITSLVNLLTKAPGKVTKAPNKNRKMALGELKQADPNYSGSQVLNILRLEFGIQHVNGIGMDKLTRLQSTVVLNQLLSILRNYPSPIGLEANAIFQVPDRNGRGNIPQPIRFVIKEDGEIYLVAEEGPKAVEVSRWGSVPEAQGALKVKYGITGFKEEGASWTIVELVQLDDALQKTDTIGKNALQGIIMIRKAIGAKDTPESMEGGSYNPLLHTLSLTNGAFTGIAPFFTGFGAGASQPSAGTILHEVGHAIEYAAINQRMREVQDDIEITKIEIAALEKKAEALTEGIGKLIDEKFKAIEKLSEEKWARLEEQEKLIGAVKINAGKEKEEAKNLHKAGIAAFNQLDEKLPKRADSVIIDLMGKYYDGLEKCIDAVNAFKYDSLEPDALGTILQALSGAEAARDAWKENVKTKELPYSSALHEALAIYQKVKELLSSIVRINQRLAELNKGMAKLQAHYEMADAGLKEKYDSGQKELSDQRKEIWDKTTEERRRNDKSRGILGNLDEKKLDRQTPTLLKFVELVKKNDIEPITSYALKEWGKGNPSEFFAEAYHLFLNDPGYLKRSSTLLYDYFHSGNYL